jgi:hypothetical protein
MCTQNGEPSEWDGSTEILDDVMKNEFYKGNLVLSYKIR